MTQEENTKAAIENSGSNLIEAYDQEINRLEELERTLDNYVLKQPHKGFLALDLWEFLEDYPNVKASIERYIRHCLIQLSTHLYDRAVIKRYQMEIIELEQLKEKEK